MLPDAEDRPETALARLGASHASWQALPGGRTNRLWKVGAFVVKRFDPLAASPLFPNDPAAEARALTLLGPQSLAPTLRAQGKDWIIYDHVPGPTWPIAKDPSALARMLHRLHSAPVPPQSFRLLPNGSTALLNHGAAFAPADLPAPTDPRLPPIPARPVHADPVLGNILDAADGPRLIDWQCPGMGDPCEDLATLISPAMMWLYTGRKALDGWGEAVLAAYPDATIADRARALLPIYHWRILAHCAWKAARGDADYATVLRMQRNA